jgi:hypothetical protein
MKGLRNRTPTMGQNVIELIEAMKAARGDSDPLVAETPSERDGPRAAALAPQGGVDRHELHHRPPNRPDSTTCGLRVACVAVRSDDPPKIQRRAGHQHFETTQRYIRMAEALSEGFGEPFPSAPRFRHPIPRGKRTRFSNYAKRKPEFAGRTGLEPAASGVTGRRYNQLNYRPVSGGRLHTTSEPRLKRVSAVLSRGRRPTWRREPGGGPKGQVWRDAPLVRIRSAYQ